MPFSVVFLAHAPDAEPEKHRCMIETSKYRLISVVVRDQVQAVEECKKLVKEEGIHSVLLCPGFTHRNVAEITEAVGDNVSVASTVFAASMRRLSNPIPFPCYRILSTIIAIP